MPDERQWDDEATGLPDPLGHLGQLGHLGRRGLSGYGPEGEILLMGQFAGAVHRATGWRRVVGVTVAGLLLASILGSALVSVVELAAGSHPAAYQSPAHLP